MTEPARIVTTEGRSSRGRTSWTLHESPQAPQLVFCDLIVHSVGGPSVRLGRIEVGKLETVLAEIRREAERALPLSTWEVRPASNGTWYVTCDGENVSSGWFNANHARGVMERRKAAEAATRA